MRKAELLALAERIEATTEGSREMDVLIWWLVDDIALDSPIDSVGDRDDYADFWSVDKYTTSLDAAASLVPDGHSFAVCSHDSDHGRASAKVGPKTADAKTIPWSRAATAPLALCAAALRAIAEGVKE